MRSNTRRSPAFPGCFTSRSLRVLTVAQVARLQLAELSARAGRGLLDLVAPGWCRLCQSPCPALAALCENCAASVPWIDGACERCGAPVPVRNEPLGLSRPNSVAVRDCSGCVGTRWRHDRIVAAGVYTGALRDLVLLHKFHGDPGARAFLVEALVQRFGRLQHFHSVDSVDSVDRVDPHGSVAVCPVPQHPLKSLLRSRDPCRELADGLARAVGLPCVRLLRKVRWTRPQMRLSRPERRRNPRDVFRSRRAAPAYVVLIDDVVTTGSTVSECARALKDAGARRVDVLAAARALG
jgi:predicted amidophosphoribosyltransferase